MRKKLIKEWIDEKINEGRRENVLFNDALNTFLIWLYGVIKINEE